MADITAFPTIPQIVEHLGTTSTFIATAAITQGQVVAISATGVSDSVVASVAESGGKPIGVAITSQATAGGKVGVAMIGSIVRVAIADDTTGADAGDLLETNDCAVKGTVSTAAEAAIGGAVGTAHPQIVGVALDDIAGGSYGRMLVLAPSWMAQLNNA
jgi:hypothetical protein